MADAYAGPLHPPGQENSGLVGNMAPNPHQFHGSRAQGGTAPAIVCSSPQRVQHKAIPSSSLAPNSKALASISNPLDPNATSGRQADGSSSAEALTEVCLPKTEPGMAQSKAQDAQHPCHA